MEAAPARQETDERISLSEVIYTGTDIKLQRLRSRGGVSTVHHYALRCALACLPLLTRVAVRMIRYPSLHLAKTLFLQHLF